MPLACPSKIAILYSNNAIVMQLCLVYNYIFIKEDVDSYIFMQIIGKCQEQIKKNEKSRDTTTYVLCKPDSVQSYSL